MALARASRGRALARAVADDLQIVRAAGQKQGVLGQVAVLGQGALGRARPALAAEHGKGPVGGLHAVQVDLDPARRTCLGLVAAAGHGREPGGQVHLGLAVDLVREGGRGEGFGRGQGFHSLNGIRQQRGQAGLGSGRGRGGGGGWPGAFPGVRSGCHLGRCPGCRLGCRPGSRPGRRGPQRHQHRRVQLRLPRQQVGPDGAQQRQHGQGGQALPAAVLHMSSHGLWCPLRRARGYWPVRTPFSRSKTGLRRPSARSASSRFVVTSSPFTDRKRSCAVGVSPTAAAFFMPASVLP